MLARAAAFGIEVHAWWPCFQDAIGASKMPEAGYPGRTNEVFLDPARAQVGANQARLLTALLERYRFNGVALDWVRFNDRPDGASGPLGERFAVLLEHSPNKRNQIGDSQGGANHDSPWRLVLEASFHGKSSFG